MSEEVLHLLSRGFLGIVIGVFVVVVFLGLYEVARFIVEGLWRWWGRR